MKRGIFRTIRFFTALTLNKRCPTNKIHLNDSDSISRSSFSKIEITIEFFQKTSEEEEEETKKLPEVFYGKSSHVDWRWQHSTIRHKSDCEQQAKDPDDRLDDWPDQWIDPTFLTVTTILLSPIYGIHSRHQNIHRSTSWRRWLWSIDYGMTTNFMEDLEDNNQSCPCCSERDKTAQRCQ